MLHVAVDRKRFGALLLHSHLYLAFVLVAVMSLVVSADAAGSSVKFAMYLMTTLFAAWVAISCPVDRLVDILFRIGVAVLIVHVVLFPVIGSQWDYDPLHRPTVLGTQAYAGIFGHKNLAGAFFGLMALICFVRMLVGPRRQFGWSLLAMACHCVALAAAGSAGPLISMATTIAVTFGLLLLAARAQGAASIYWLRGSLRCALVAYVVPSDELYGLVGRSDNLTGRSFLWSVLAALLLAAPVARLRVFRVLQRTAERARERADADGALEHRVRLVRELLSRRLSSVRLCSPSRGGAHVLSAGAGVVEHHRLHVRAAGTYWISALAMLLFVVIASANDSSQLLHNYFGCVLVFWCYFGPEAGQAAPQRVFTMRASEAGRH